MTSQTTTDTASVWRDTSVLQRLASDARAALTSAADQAEGFADLARDDDKDAEAERIERVAAALSRAAEQAAEALRLARGLA